MTDAIRVRVVLVSYFGAADAVEAVRSLHPEDEEDIQVVIVDNSGDKTELTALDRLARQTPRVVIARASDNLGYFGGACLALSEFADEPADWTVVANPDLTFAPDFLDRLRAMAPDRIIAPAVISLVTGHDQNPYLRFRPGQGARLRWRLIYAVPALARLYNALVHHLRRVRRAEVEKTVGGVIYAPHGSCFALPDAFFEAGGGLQHPTLLFGEEITLAETCRRLQLPVVHDPSVKVQHREHASTGVWRSTLLLRIQRDSVRDVVHLLREGDRQ